jgi:hypothetical protein
MSIIIPLMFIMLLPLVIIGVGYYLDFKHDKRDFVGALKNIVRQLVKLAAITALLTIGGKFIYQLFPLDYNYGKRHNTARVEAGIPLIEPEWKLAEYAGSRYAQWWLDSTGTDRRTHTLKIIHFNLLGPTEEFDYFGKPDVPFRLETKYDYGSKATSYSIIKPKTGTFINFAAAQPLPNEIILPIAKEEFEEILKEWQPE